MLMIADLPFYDYGANGKGKTVKEGKLLETVEDFKKFLE